MNYSKAELARKLEVSPAYITMLCSGQRNLGKKLQKKVNKLGLTNSFKCLTFNQGVTGSRPVRPSLKKEGAGLGAGRLLTAILPGVPEGG